MLSEFGEVGVIPEFEKMAIKAFTHGVRCLANVNTTRAGVAVKYIDDVRRVTIICSSNRSRGISGCRGDSIEIYALSASGFITGT